MPAGLQCWDSNGKLIVDIGDYNCRFIGESKITVSNNSNTATASYPGVSANGSFAVVVASSSDPSQFGAESYAVRTYDGGYRIFSTASSFPNTTFTVHIYGFL